MAALADVAEAEPQRLGDLGQPLEVRGGEVIGAAVDGALGGDERGVAEALDLVLVGGHDRRPGGGATGAEDHSQLVDEDLLRLPRLGEAGGVDGLQQLGDDEEVAEDGELLDQVAHLGAGGPALGEPGAVAVVGDHRVLHHHRPNPGEEAVPPGAVAARRLVDEHRHVVAPSAKHERIWMIREEYPALGIDLSMTGR